MQVEVNSFSWMLSLRVALLSYYGLRIIMQEIDVQMSNIEEENDQPTTIDITRPIVPEIASSVAIHQSSVHLIQNNCIGNCPLCLDNVAEPTALPCGHICCWSCITGYVYRSRSGSGEPSTQKSKCPVCRHEFERQKIRALFSYS